MAGNWIQQNPTFQSQMNPTGVAQRPTADVGWGGQGGRQAVQTQSAKESFLQRQKRLYGQSANPAGSATGTTTARTAPAPATSTGSSPVTSDGRLAPSAPKPDQPIQPQPGMQPQPAQAPVPTGVNPNPAFPVGPTNMQPGAPTPVQQPGMVAAPNQAAAGSYNFSQFAVPNQSVDNGQQTDLLRQMMANPFSMSDENVAQLQAKQREQAALMAQQLGQQAGAAAASRGTLNSGMMDLNNRRIGEQLSSDVLSGNRDIALAKMQQDRQDQLNLLGASNDVLNNQLQRSVTGYQTLLGGQGQQADENFRRQQMAEGNALQGRQLDIQNSLGQGGLSIDRSRLGEQGREFDLSHALDINRFFEGQRQYNGTQGFNYAQLGQQGQQGMFNWLAQMYGK